MPSKLAFFMLLTIIILSFDLILAADKEKYIIWPVSNISQKESDKIAGLIGNLVTARHKPEVYASLRRGSTIPKFWTATLSLTASQKLEGDPLIRDIHVSLVVAEDEELTSITLSVRSPVASADLAYATQFKAPIELRVVSQPKPEMSPYARIGRFENYVYNTNSPDKAYIYHVEFGIDQSHPEFSGRDIEWLYTPLTIQYGMDSPHAIPDRERHSMCTASKAAGTNYGAARLAKLVIVKIPSYAEESLGEVFSTITDHIKDNGREGQSVVSISWSSGVPVNRYSPFRDRGFQYPTLWQDMKEDMRELTKVAAIFCAAGNHALKIYPGSRRLRTEIDTAPAVLGVAIPVGNCDKNGQRMPKSQYFTGYPRQALIYGPGEDVQCAESQGTNEAGSRFTSGTSQATAIVAGTVADLIASGQIPDAYRRSSDDIHNFILLHASWKRDSGLSVIWNGVTATDNPPLKSILQLQNHPHYNLSLSNAADA